MASSIEVFDPVRMEHVKTISLGIEYGSCTWVVPGDGCWYVCFAHYDNNGEKAGGEVIRDGMTLNGIGFKAGSCRKSSLRRSGR